MSGPRRSCRLGRRVPGSCAFGPTRARGFTLIEVLVALAIVAIGMAAVLEALTSSANTAMYLQDKTFAEWVAFNRIETVRLTSSNPPPDGDSNGTVDYAGRSWEWRQKVSDLEQAPGVRRIVVDVRPAGSKAGDDRGWYASATGFAGNAIAPETAVGAPVWSPGPIMGLPGLPGLSGTPGAPPNPTGGGPTPP
ncbi:MAG TPA: type II secretion system minor pseudopilin GspI [Steroidobacteraceae bacterium]|nr:type II secretion system minor pseudopilin GspI [Steroidobacteraceae bacterium]